MRTTLVVVLLAAAACSEEPTVDPPREGCRGWSRSLPVTDGYADRFFYGNTGVRVAAVDDVVLAAWPELVDAAHEVRVALLDADTGAVLRDDVVVPLPAVALVNGLAVQATDDGFLVFAWTFDPSRLVVAAVETNGDVSSVAETAYARSAHELPVARLGEDVLAVGVDPSLALPIRATPAGLITQAPDAALEAADGCTSVVALPDARAARGMLRAWCSAPNFIERPTAAELWRFDADGTPVGRTPIDRRVPSRPGQLVPVDGGLLVVLGTEDALVAVLLDDDGALLDGPTTITAFAPDDEGELIGTWIEPSIGFEAVPHEDARGTRGALVVYEHDRRVLLTFELVLRTARLSVVDGTIVVEDDGRGAATLGYGHGASRVGDDLLLGYLAGHVGLPAYRETLEVERRCAP